MKRIIYPLGIGHNSPVFIDLARDCGYEVESLYHYNNERTGEFDHGYPIVGSFDDLFALPTLEGKEFLLTMGDSRIRRQLTERILAKGGNVPTLIHPTAVVSRYAKIDSVGCYISCYSFVQADSEIEEGTILLSHVNISHTNKVGKDCFFAGGTTLGAYTVVEDNVFFGIGCLSISGKVPLIGHDAYIGAGALLTKEVAPYSKMVGIPARNIRDNAL